jgi:hypothetical protein
MTHEIRRVVTGGDEKGRAVVISDGPCTPTSSNRIGLQWTSGALREPARIVAHLHPRDRGGLGCQVVGRLGSLSGPLIGGVLVSRGMRPSQLFQISSIAPLLACASFDGVCKSHGA